ncbi:unnamed protein product [Ixodes pacificus]
MHEAPAGGRAFERHALSFSFCQRLWKYLLWQLKFILFTNTNSLDVPPENLSGEIGFCFTRSIFHGVTIQYGPAIRHGQNIPCAHGIVRIGAFYPPFIGVLCGVLDAQFLVLVFLCWCAYYQ